LHARIEEEGYVSSTPLNQLPSNLPVPVDDGACDHLPGTRLPDIDLGSTSGATANLAALPGRTVVYCYPRTGRPDRELPEGWDAIPGARGCTPQSCAFRDHYQNLQDLGAGVFGLSTQTTDYQREAVERLHLPFALLSDADLELKRSMCLPTFEFDGETLVRRLTMIVRDGRVETVWYPVFPPDADAERVLHWLRNNPVQV
jgi:peroxiredoxin